MLRNAKHDQFTKTGSGQPQEKLRARDAFSAGCKVSDVQSTVDLATAWGAANVLTEGACDPRDPTCTGLFLSFSFIYVCPEPVLVTGCFPYVCPEPVLVK